MWDGKLKEDVDRMRKMSVFKKMQNITLEEYLTLLEQMKQAALSDMDLFPEKETILDKGIMPSEKVLDFPVDCNTLTGSVNL